MRIRLAYLIMVLCLLGGCLGRRGFIPIRYYSVDTLNVSVPQVTRSWPITLGVRPFTAATRYGDRMLYRLSEVEIGFYEYNRWVDPPEEMVASAIVSTVRTSGLFRHVVASDDVQPTAWMLSGELMRFDEVRTREKNLAECWLRVELRRARNDQLLWSEVLKASVPLAAGTPEALALAMRRAVQQVATHLVTGLEKANLPQS